MLDAVLNNMLFDVLEWVKKIGGVCDKTGLSDSCVLKNM